ncbi:helix-turn-helix domain-containing protein [Phytohabitans sp. ZYX-F-186]|uniref:Helix-turn-helix domain-containing protein n=1 Tax=Phytohabitans maris TaxID=3071409 RepID=A0ABU0ZU85_9ACTN|nr:helix-turn-helix domain-containing protein [Phytohabitans sp. ZYX-F-186]MDQ7910606.1 helix-turn-helix domain-containing protein [Phytohabitans sp. ZYX-F-186]
MAKATLRADARRNLDKLRDAALGVFREKGLHAPLDEIARRAGVSSGTLYNRFGSREALIDAVAPELAADSLRAVARRAIAERDPWEGFASYVMGVCELQASCPALNDVISRRYASEQLTAICRATEERERYIIERAQREGLLRADFTREDLFFVFWSTATLVRHTSGAAPEGWRRAVGFLLDGLRAEAAHPLPAEPLTPDQVEEVMFRLGEGGPL